MSMSCYKIRGSNEFELCSLLQHYLMASMPSSHSARHPRSSGGNTRGAIFLSYRRSDAAGYVGRLAETLVKEFGTDRIFRDVASLPAGTDFANAISKAIDSCS